MAGPGGGPPRRSHTKSRKGCETCKKRHIRCDETFPQCRNCTKHKQRCPYQDMGDERAASPETPQLGWTAEIVADIEQWKISGTFPFPLLNIYPMPDPNTLTEIEMRLVHHVASISYQLTMMDANGFTLWTHQIPTILKIGASHRFVLEALLAFSAMHLSFMYACPLVGNMAYEHRGRALAGLHEAISSFSQETSDAVLAASLVLSWQATDWPSWTQLMQGTSTVIDAMGPWKHTSQFGDFIRDHSTCPTAPPSPRPDHKPSPPSQEDIDVLNRTHQQLQKVENHMKQLGVEAKVLAHFAELISFVKGARKVGSSVAHQFDRLQPFRQWVFWLPVLYLQQTNGSPTALVVIAHYYTVALLMERLFPEIGAAYFGSLALGPVEEIARRLHAFNIAGTINPVEDLQTPVDLMQFPLKMVEEFRSRMGWNQPARSPSFPQFSQEDLYMAANSPSMQMASSANSPYLVYGGEGANPAFSYSTEDLSIMTGAVTASNSAISPLVLSSPFTHAQYLNIPSPSYGGYSPASSTFGDFSDTGSNVYNSDNDASYGYSDHNEDFQGYDMGFSGNNNPMLGGSNQYGLGSPDSTSTTVAWLSTTPTYPPPEGAGVFHGFPLSSSFPHSVASSPYLSAQQFSSVSQPQSPIPTLSFPVSSGGHRHTTSSASAPPGFRRTGTV